MEAVFIFSLAVIAYTYLGYPGALFIIGLIFRNPVKRSESLASVTIIIAAHNEERDIKAKLRNTCELDYPREKLEIIVVSDHSSDGTDRIVEGFDPGRVRLIRTTRRCGKTGAQNLAIEQATGDILVFSDATAVYEKDALKKIVRNFHDETVGGVEGRLVYLEADSGFMGNKDLIKSYEARIKTMEGRIWAGVGDNGAFYAIRRQLCRFLREDLTSDFAAPLDVLRQGKRFIFEPEAISYEKVSNSSSDEFRRKIRTVRAGMNVFFNSLDLLNVSRSRWAAYVLFSRKLCRWLSSLLLPLLFLSNMFLLDYPLYRLFFSMQVCFYLLSAVGIVAGDSADKFSIISIPRNFVLVNFASIRGIVNYLSSGNKEIWTPARG